MEKWKIQSNIEKIERGGSTNFLNKKDIYTITKILDKRNVKYQVFIPYEDAEKQVIYVNNKNVTLYLMKTKEKLTHPKILGTLFSLSLVEDCFGDIIIDKDHYYIMIVDKIKKYMETNFIKVGKIKVSLEERDFSEIEDYQLSYQERKLSISSLRIDNVVAKLIPTSRKKAIEEISNQRVTINYELLKNNNYIVKENDIFSIRGVGKFKVVSTTNTNEKYILILYKYI